MSRGQVELAYMKGVPFFTSWLNTRLDSSSAFITTNVPAMWIGDVPAGHGHADAVDPHAVQGGLDDDVTVVAMTA